MSLEDQVLTTLEYLREYRTYFYIALSWQVNKSTAYRIIRKVEDCLMNSGVFSLPSKKKLLEPNHEIEIVVVDVIETPIERPKKTKTILQWQKQTAHVQVPNYSRPDFQRNYLYSLWQRKRA